MSEIEALQTIREHGHLLRLENTDAWYAAGKPPRSLHEAWDATEVSIADAHALIDAGLVKEHLQYLLEGGTLVGVYTLTERANP